MANSDEAQQKCLDAASEVTGDYQCPQCGERYFEDKMRFCFYCENRFCPHCRKRDSDPVTGETVDICNVCAEKIQELAENKRKAALFDALEKMAK